MKVAFYVILTLLLMILASKLFDQNDKFTIMKAGVETHE